MTSLEVHYRRLLRLFPQQHRARFLEEMVTTLMEGSAPSQRLPQIRETLNLLWNAAWLRFGRRQLPRARDSRWADAAAIAGLIGSFLMFAMLAGWGLVLNFTWHVEGPFDFPLKPLWWTTAWLLSALLALAGWRVAAVSGAWIAALVPLAYAVFSYLTRDTTVLTAYWPHILGAATVAVCLTIKAPKHRARQLLGTPLTVITCAVLVLFGASKYIDSILIEMSGTWQYSSYLGIPGLPGGPISMILVPIVLATVIAVVARSERRIRRRLIAIALPAVAMVPIVRNGFAGWEMSSMRFYPTPVMLTIPQLLILVILPILMFVTGLLLVRRADDRDELMELGRQELARRTGQSQA